ncbi:mitogen-activated protein kinase kinase kinase 1-like isoform X2 [Mercurialis annua]|uniref:mitogen-activated protein kinase kinase kinase 1-like isoform X2 n=1 Tax=Mercurialis annua TaxID=3986 RepID=UPI00215FD2FB|nr:mitogen-activated protein kinase kinase kinase 1-like isoform X2 [Mercurialis annua]
MHHFPRFFTHNKDKHPPPMDPKSRSRRPRPRLERKNAAKDIDYDASASCSSLDNSSSYCSLVTRSLDIPDRTSFRIEGTDGEFDRICRSLGLTGPEDFAIPVAAWEAMKVRSASDLLPCTKLYSSDSPRLSEVKQEEESELCARVLDTVIINDSNELTRNEPATAKLNTTSKIVGIKGVRPPLLKPPPSIVLPAIDNGCSTWDLLRDFAPENDRSSMARVNNVEDSGSDGGGDDDVDTDVNKEEEEGNLLTIRETAVLSESYSFTTSNDDDSSSTTTDPMSNISPNARFRRIINDWQKGDLLGRGSFGTVYEGISDDGFFFAVKEVSLLDQGSQGKQSIYQLEQEIALLSQFEHENIVQYYGTDKDDSKLYIFLQLVTKGSLMNLYQRYHLRDSQVSAYTRQILHGLKYLHDKNVLHRDIKCANILVDASGSVKLADFGLAKATKLNDVKSCKGTAFWMAPEVVNRKTHGYGLPADIWSLGCTVLEMLTRQIPYSHLECMQALYRIGKGVPPPVPDSLSKDARDFILQCLQVNPNNRPTAAQLLEHQFVKRPLSTSSGSASPFHGRRF